MLTYGKTGLADRKLLAGLVFAVGDYMALTLQRVWRCISEIS